jgi:hypothetical protein
MTYRKTKAWILHISDVNCMCSHKHDMICSYFHMNLLPYDRNSRISLILWMCYLPTEQQNFTECVNVLPSNRTADFYWTHVLPFDRTAEFVTFWQNGRISLNVLPSDRTAEFHWTRECVTFRQNNRICYLPIEQQNFSDCVNVLPSDRQSGA